MTRLRLGVAGRGILASIILLALSSASPAQQHSVPDADSPGDQIQTGSASTDTAPPAANSPDNPSQASADQSPPPISGDNQQTAAAEPSPQDQGAQAPEAPEAHVLQDFVHDEARMWSAPFRPKTYNSHTLLYAIPFAVVTAALIASDRYTTNALPNTAGQLHVSNIVSDVGSPYAMVGISGITYLVARVTKNRHARETGLLAMEALAHSQIFGLVIKEATQRARPYTNDITDEGFWQHGASFPSGHAMAAFSVAAVFAREYHDHIAVPILAYTFASVIAFSRVSGRQHYLSDVFVGGAGGFLIGRYVYNEHHDDDLPGSPARRISRLRPDVAVGGNGVSLVWKF